MKPLRLNTPSFALPFMTALLAPIFTCLTMSLASPAQADLLPEKITVSEQKKTNHFISDGLFIGGDRAINTVSVKDIQHGVHPDFERIVIVLEGNKNGEPAAIARPPYYQVSIESGGSGTSGQKIIQVTIWGRPKLDFDPTKIKKAIRKSALISQVVLLPRVEPDSWTFAFEMKSASRVEVFELTHPVRVTLDIRRQKH